MSSANQFQTYLGFKKNMTFNIVEQVKMELLNDNANVVFIDNVIDENLFTLSTNSDSGSLRRDIIKRCADKDEYVRAFNSLVNKNDELKIINDLLTELSDKLQNNYILIKNHTSTYSKFFKELGQNFRQVNK